MTNIISYDSIDSIETILQVLLEIKNTEIIKLWKSLEDIPIDEKGCIEQDFYIWKKGTEKFAHWHWFDEKSQNGVYDLVYK